MTGSGLVAVIWTVSLCAMSAAAADVTRLRQQSETKTTSQMAGAPFDGEKKKELSFHSYLLVVPADRPSVVVRSFETPTEVEIRDLHAIVWALTADSLR
jgi:hypothetical protein